LHLIDAVGYIEFLALQKKAALVITDSGGIQEETTFLGIPCLTVGDNTERPITVWEGTNKLIQINEIEYEVEQILRGNGKKGKIPDLWDGKAAGRILNILEGILRSATQRNSPDQSGIPPQYDGFHLRGRAGITQTCLQM